jgi:hypothetical protein
MSDLIVALPESDGFTAIAMITDRHSKQIIVEPCTNNINTNQLAEILIRRVFTQYRLPKKMISDRGPQYSSKVMKAVLKAMGVVTDSHVQFIFLIVCTYCHSAWETLVPKKTNGSLLV